MGYDITAYLNKTTAIKKGDHMEYMIATNNSNPVKTIFVMLLGIIFFLLASAFINIKIIEIPYYYFYLGFVMVLIYGIFKKFMGDL